MGQASGSIKDRGVKGLRFQDKRIVLSGASHIEPMGSITLFVDFIEDVAADSPYYTITQSGTALTAGAIDGAAGAPTAGHGGWLGGKTDDVDAEIDEISFGGLGTGAGTPWMYPARAGNGVLITEFGFVIPTALTARQYYVGFSDDPTEGTGTNGSLNITGTYTQVSPATDAAGFIFSSLATAPTVWKYASVNGDTDGSMSATNDVGPTGVVDAYTVLRTEIDSGGNAFFYSSSSGSASIGRQPVNAVGSVATAVATTSALLPIFTAAATTTTGVEWEIDYCFAAAPR